MIKKFKLEQSDIEETFGFASASSIIHSKPYNRNNQLRQYEIILRHKPTGISVSKTLGPSQLSKTKWKELINKSFAELYKPLEHSVARKLKIKGY